MILILLTSLLSASCNTGTTNVSPSTGNNNTTAATSVIITESPNENINSLSSSVSTTPDQDNPSPCTTCSSDSSGAFSSGDAQYGLFGDWKVDKVPKPGEETKLTWTIKSIVNRQELHAWVQFQYDSGKPCDDRFLPMSEVKKTILVSGEPEYLGVLLNGEQKQFDAVVKFPLEGTWSGQIMFLGKAPGWNMTRTSEGDKYVQPWSPGPYCELIVSEQSPRYGYCESPFNRRPKDYSQGSASITIPNDVESFTGFIDIEKPPVLNEPVTINWGSSGIKDINDVTTELIFYHWENYRDNRIPAEKLVTQDSALFKVDKVEKNSALIDLITDDSDGLSGWRMESGSNKEIPVTRGWAMTSQSLFERTKEVISPQYHTNVTFTEEGDWSVHCVTSSPYLNHAVTCFSICFNISKTGSSWGWKEPHEPEGGNLLPWKKS